MASTDMQGECERRNIDIGDQVLTGSQESRYRSPIVRYVAYQSVAYMYELQDRSMRCIDQEQFNVEGRVKHERSRTQIYPVRESA